MEQYQENFKRYEKKYMLKETQYNRLRKELNQRMEEDQYGLHTICNIYYDTPDFRMIRKSLEKPVYKEKLRLRSYGVPEKNDPVFLEIKKKFKGIVYKRRVSMTDEKAKGYLNKGMATEIDSQIMHEIDWLVHRYESIQPAVYIAYDRIALFQKENPDLRVTFDQKIRFRTENLDLCGGSYGTEIINKNEILMEVKIPGAVPIWMSELFGKLQIYPVSFSKYGMCYQKYILPSFMQKTEQRGGQNCA